MVFLGIIIINDSADAVIYSINIKDHTILS